jgi:hypothetical protein
VKGGGEGNPRFPSEFGGHGLGLLYEKSSLVRLAGRCGTLQPRTPRGAKQAPGYCMELKLVWFGDFKFSFGSCVSAHRVSSKCFSVQSDPMWGSEDGRGFLLLVFRSVFFC